ncbi:hypothetical protein [Halomarina ordinaria]|uniref:Uncharacterized protein n=1 Tax=Halomarina ordinaria TaxID=3033939 RepID=A0ABD5U801_9EURY|nr:hypothetical protein [Halomarina sp. PSRA2]
MPFPLLSAVRRRRTGSLGRTALGAATLAMVLASTLTPPDPLAQLLVLSVTLLPGLGVAYYGGWRRVGVLFRGE